MAADFGVGDQAARAVSASSDVADVLRLACDVSVMLNERR
jgi:hypothetical protein